MFNKTNQEVNVKLFKEKEIISNVEFDENLKCIEDIKLFLLITPSKNYYKVKDYLNHKEWAFEEFTKAKKKYDSLGVIK